MLSFDCFAGLMISPWSSRSDKRDQLKILSDLSRYDLLDIFFFFFGKVPQPSMHCSSHGGGDDGVNRSKPNRVISLAQPCCSKNAAHD